MKLKDLPLEIRCAFEQIPGAHPNVGFRNGRFWVIEWVVHESFWTQLPRKVEFEIGSDWGVYPSCAWTTGADAQLKMAKFAMNPKGISKLEEQIMAHRVKNLIWC